MATWSSRTSGYKLGVLVLFLGAAFYVIGYAAPFWVYFGNSGYGLWMVCYEDRYDRLHCSHEKSPARWFHAVQAMASLGLIGLGMCILYVIIIDFCQNTSTHNRFLEFASAVSGLCGFVGCMIFVGKTEKYLDNYYSWGFGLNLTGSLLIMVTAVIIFFTNRPDSANPAIPGTVLSTAPVTTTVQGTNMVIVQQGQSYPPPGQGYPAQPGTGYGAQPGYGGAQAGYGGAQAGYTYPPQAYPAAVPPPYPGGYPPASAPPQDGGVAQGYSGYNYTQSYSGQAAYGQKPM